MYQGKRGTAGVVVYHADGGPRAQPCPRRTGRAAPGAGPRRAAAALPAQGRAGIGRGLRRRGAGALGASRPRAAAARRLPAGGRAVRPDRAADDLGAAPRAGRQPGLAVPRASTGRSRSTCRPATSRPTTSPLWSRTCWVSSRCPPDRLHVEVTETALAADREAAAAGVNALARARHRRSPSTTSVSATRACPSCARCRSPRSRSTGRSSPARSRGRSGPGHRRVGHRPGPRPGRLGRPPKGSRPPRSRGGSPRPGCDAPRASSSPAPRPGPSSCAGTAAPVRTRRAGGRAAIAAADREGHRAMNRPDRRTAVLCTVSRA